MIGSNPGVTGAPLIGRKSLLRLRSPGVERSHRRVDPGEFASGTECLKNRSSLIEQLPSCLGFAGILVQGRSRHQSLDGAAATS